MNLIRNDGSVLNHCSKDYTSYLLQKGVYMPHELLRVLCILGLCLLVAPGSAA